MLESQPTDYRYPQLPYDDAKKLLSQSGSYWASSYDGRSLLRSLLFARAQVEKQALRDLDETQKCLDRFAVPLWHHENIYPLVLRESAVLRRPIQLGDPYVLGPNDNRTPVLGGEDFLQPWGVAVPSELVQLNAITNRIQDASLCWLPGFDFVLHGGELLFATNPFANELLPVIPVFEGTEVVDREVTLWLINPQFDQRFIDTHFGYTVGLQAPSTAAHRDAVNAAWDAMIEGSSSRSLRQLIAAAVDAPLARDTEVVDRVITDAARQHVITDKHAYSFPLDVTITVAAGDELTAGDTLCDVVIFHDISDGSWPDNLDVVVGPELLWPGYSGGLVFRDEDVPLVVETVDGKTKVSFELHGFPTDVDAFWDEVHVRGLGTTTLARLLDVRGPNAATEPVPAVLPATVNPARFLIENIFRFNATAVEITLSAVSAQRIVDHLRILRRLVPPWTLLMLYFRLEAGSDAMDPTQSGDATQPGASETLTGLLTATITDSLDPTTIGSDQVTVYLVNCFC